MDIAHRTQPTFGGKAGRKESASGEFNLEKCIHIYVDKRMDMWTYIWIYVYALYVYVLHPITLPTMIFVFVNVRSDKLLIYIFGIFPH